MDFVTSYKIHILDSNLKHNKRCKIANSDSLFTTIEREEIKNVRVKLKSNYNWELKVKTERDIKVQIEKEKYKYKQEKDGKGI